MRRTLNRERAATIIAFGACMGIAAGAALASGGAPEPGKVVCPNTCAGWIDYEPCYFTCCRGVSCGHCTDMSFAELFWAGCSLSP